MAGLLGTWVVGDGWRDGQRMVVGLLEDGWMNGQRMVGRRFRGRLVGWIAGIFRRLEALCILEPAPVLHDSYVHN